MTRIEVLAPDGFVRKPGQHCFLRFPSLFILDNHPFTIASYGPIPASRNHPEV